ncbi:NAD(P)H-dependent oxidoreductase [Lentilitoribacter sp. Alg239-R112]|uniref:NAD(P)H-dependent oxidoreductase n=1 Tax=Lentilitoribacter sp. Alg239-R112 TaxID=2305987 RepID=UPI0013A6D6EB|nr:NAD(P)H-dependent oxidoreductase [Lentilitoribacter sp. Alg239-R112]
MKCLVVIAHPLTDSLCNSLAAEAIEQLNRNGHKVVEENLYDVDFKPVLTADERLSYYGNFDTSGLDNSVSRLQEADALVLAFPTWWFGFPAILKGWFDRVWAPGIAFENADDLDAIKPKLDGLRNVLVITTLGSPWWVDRLVMFRPVKRIVKHALLGACAKNAKLDYLSLYRSEKLAPDVVERFKVKIARKIDAWPR